MLPSAAPWGSVSAAGWKVPKPEFTMHTVALRVKAGADSFPCPSRQAAQQQHHYLVACSPYCFAVMPTTHTQGSAYGSDSGAQQWDKPQCMSFA